MPIYLKGRQATAFLGVIGVERMSAALACGQRDAQLAPTTPQPKI